MEQGRNRAGNRLVVRWFIAAGVAALLLSACASPMSREAAAPAPMSQAPAAGATERSVGIAPDSTVAQAGEGTADAAVSLERKVIARAHIQLVVEDAAATVEAIEALMDEVGGYIANSNLYKGSYNGAERLQGTLTLRVPAEQLDATLDRLAGMGVDVPQRGLDREDITDQYSDVDAQLRNLEATEIELREMLAEVRARPNATTEDIMAVYRTLTEVRAQIEQLQGRKNMWDNLIALSTIEVTLTPDTATLPVVEEGWRPAVVTRDALRALVNAMQVLGNVAIWVVVFLLPLLVLAAIPLAILFFVLRWLLRRLNRKTPQPAPSGPPA